MRVCFCLFSRNTRTKCIVVITVVYFFFFFFAAVFCLYDLIKIFLNVLERAIK